jgi:hypothetical protein
MNQLAIKNRSVNFKWKNGLGSPEIISIIYAIAHGHTTKDELLRALPIFSFDRILNSLERLITAGLVTITDQHLILNSEAMKLDRLTTNSLELPIQNNIEKMSVDDEQYLFDRLGINNISLATKLIRVALS